MELFYNIKNFLGSGNIHTGPARNNGDSTVTLEVNTTSILFNSVIPLYNSGTFTNKSLDFKAWSILVKIYYFGYHTILEGLSLFNEIKSSMNNFRLTTNKLNLIIDNNLLLEKISDLFSKPAIYEIRYGVRFLAGTNKLVSEKLI